MTGFLLGRLLGAAGVVLAMSALVFLGVYAIGNPVDVLMDPAATQAMREEAIRRFGLDRPLWEQYLVFLGSVARGDFGSSFVFRIPVLDLILSRLPATLELATAAMLIATILGVPLGLWAGYRPDSASGRAINALATLGFSVPTFWVGLLLILLFSVELRWLPSGGRGPADTTVLGMNFSAFSAEGWRHLLLPALNLSLFKLGLLIRLVRAGTEEVMGGEHVRFARAQGLREREVVRLHVLKNIGIPVATVFGLEFGSTLAFAVVTETVFNWPGMGKLIIESIGSLDRPVMVAYLVLVVLLFVAINLLVELTYGLLDPRARAGGAGGAAA